MLKPSQRGAAEAGAAAVDAPEIARHGGGQRNDEHVTENRHRRGSHSPHISHFSCAVASLCYWTLRVLASSSCISRLQKYPYGHMDTHTNIHVHGVGAGSPVAVTADSATERPRVLTRTRPPLLDTWVQRRRALPWRAPAGWDALRAGFLRCGSRRFSTRSSSAGSSVADGGNCGAARPASLWAEPAGGAAVPTPRRVRRVPRSAA